MKLVLIADTFPPYRTSGAVQLRDLSREFARQGHSLTVMIPTYGLEQPWVLEEVDGVQVLRLRAPRTKDIGYIRRTLGELYMPFAMLRNLRQSPMASTRWDGVVWYAPSIFFGPIIRTLKIRSACRSYLIVRDIFPEWALDMGLMKRGLAYRFFKAVAKYQYSVADVIGIQTPGNATYFKDVNKVTPAKVEVLQNWLADTPAGGCSIDISSTSLAGRKIFVYAGNMGVAQGMDILLEMAASLRLRADIGFLFVGRGSDAQRLAAEAQRRKLDNVLFKDEIEPDEIAGLYSQCDVGLVALHPKHKTHNIPGKFLTYMQAGLPVLATVNEGNDLIQVIEQEGVGFATTDHSVTSLCRLVDGLITSGKKQESRERCRDLYERLFSPEKAVNQIIHALEP